MRFLLYLLQTALQEIMIGSAFRRGMAVSGDVRSLLAYCGSVWAGDVKLRKFTGG